MWFSLINAFLLMGQTGIYTEILKTKTNCSFYSSFVLERQNLSQKYRTTLKVSIVYWRRTKLITWQILLGNSRTWGRFGSVPVTRVANDETKNDICEVISVGGTWEWLWYPQECGNKGNQLPSESWLWNLHKYLKGRVPNSSAYGVYASGSNFRSEI